MGNEHIHVLKMKRMSQFNGQLNSVNEHLTCLDKLSQVSFSTGSCFDDSIWLFEELASLWFFR